jgi:hypothetical protein
MGKKEKLYKQWAEHSGLPVEAMPKDEPAVTREAPVKPARVAKVGGGGQRLRLLYILLIAAVIIICVGLVVLFMQST